MSLNFGVTPSGLFGNTAAGRGQSQAQQSANPFGSSNASGNASGSTLFGSNLGQPSKPPVGGLFGASNSNSHAQNSGLTNNQGSTSERAGGLFGNQPSNATTSNPSPFAGFGQQSMNTNTASQGLFGANTSLQQPPKNQSNANSLFGGAIAPAQSANSSFSKPQDSAVAPQTSSLFGTAQNQSAVDLKASTQQQGQGNISHSFLHSSYAQSVHRQTTAQPACFDSLVEKNKTRHHGGDQSSTDSRHLPNVQLGLGDIAKRVRQLGNVSDGSVGTSGLDSRAHYLLAASGIKPGSTRQEIDAFADQIIENGAPQHKAPWNPDSHRYVEQLQQRQTARMVAESLERAERRFNQYLEDSVDINWEEQRRKIYEHFGLAPKDGEPDLAVAGSKGHGSFGQSRRSKAGTATQSKGKSSLNRSIFGQSSMRKSVIGTTYNGQASAAFTDDISGNDLANQAEQKLDDRHLREIQRKYAGTIQSLNQVRLKTLRLPEGRRAQTTPYPLLAGLMQVEEQSGSDCPPQIIEAYKALIEIASEGTACERQWIDQYLDEVPRSANHVAMQKMILQRSKRSLEKAFFEQLSDLVAKNPKEANMGGVPTAINKVRAYVRIRANRRDLAPERFDLVILGEDYCWALLFFLIRCGMIQEAADYVVDNVAHFKTIDRNIVTFITAFAQSSDHRLEGRMHRECQNVFSAMTKVAPGDSIDPYKIATYKVIGRCELAKRNLDQIGQGVDDWIWLQFALAREINRAEENAGDVFGLEEVQETILEIGQRYFHNGAEGLGGYATYFHLQILGGMFEQAVAYLYAHSYTTAIHFAIGLAYYGLLRVSDFDSAGTSLLTRNTKDLPQVNFGRMIGYYTRDFRSSNIESAVDYLTLLCLNADLPGELGRAQAGLCYEALRELVLESREFATLLGDIRCDGSRIKGLIEDRLELLHLIGQDDLLETITVQAASVADNNGRVTDAVLLYHLSEDFDNVIAIINRTLSESLSTDLGTHYTPLQALKPRGVPSQQERDQSKGHQERVLAPAPGSSLSLTAVDDPYVLASNMTSLYSQNAMYLQRIKPANREACQVLIKLSQAKDCVSAGKWAEAYEIIQNLNLLPLKTNGNTTAIRHVSSNFNTLPPPIARLLGPIMLWTITCINRERELLASRQYGAVSGTSRQLSDQYLISARDLMVFAGLVKYRLSEKVWEAICGAVGESATY